MTGYYTASGRIMETDDAIGRGGEGLVLEVKGDPGKVAKGNPLASRGQRRKIPQADGNGQKPAPGRGIGTCLMCVAKRQ